jgi:hypothetical protein
VCRKEAKKNPEEAAKVVVEERKKVWRFMTYHDSCML